MAKKLFTPIPPMAELPPAEDIDIREVLNKYLTGEIDLICVLGPTASGKTRYAVQLAREINRLSSLQGPKGLKAEIISADSRQVYRGMDIGTGKDLGDYEEIPYHLMDIVDVLVKAGWRVVIRTTQYSGEVTDIIKTEGSRYTMVVCAGGDGTLNEAVRGLLCRGSRDPSRRGRRAQSGVLQQGSRAHPLL